MITLAALYALGGVATAVLVMYQMAKAGTDANRNINALVRVYPHPAHLAIVFVACTMIWPYMWISAFWPYAPPK